MYTKYNEWWHLKQDNTMMFPNPVKKRINYKVSEQHNLGQNETKSLWGFLRLMY